MPENFTPASFAKRLDSLCAPRVIEAQGERLEPGTVYVAPGHSHLQIRRQGSGYVTELLATPAGESSPAVGGCAFSIPQPNWSVNRRSA